VLRQLPVAIAIAAMVSVSAEAEVVAHPDPLGALASNDPVLAANKRLVFDLWRGIVNGGHVELADELLAEDYTQHSPVLPTGRAAFKQIFSSVPRRDEIPELVEPPLVAIVAEGDLVAMVLVENLAEPDGSGRYASAHFNLFRVENGRLAEHWHSVQTAPGPEVAAPENGGPQPVTGLTGTEQYALLASQDPALTANKRLVFDAWRQVVDGGREALVDVYFDEDYVDRNPNVAPGRDAFRQHIARRGDRPLETFVQDPLVAVVAENDLVVQVSMREHPHPVRAGSTYTTTWFDMFRVAGGKLAEHWDPGVRVSPVSDCEADGALHYICDLDNAEDIVPIGSSRWLVASNLNRRGQAAAAGSLYLIDAAARTAEKFFPGPAPNLRPDRALFGDCAGIDLAAFDTHGLAIRETAPARYRLYATSHGAEEAIQVFEIDATRSRPFITWVGCVPLPTHVWANSVAILDDGGFVATQFQDPTDPDSITRILSGEPNGGVYEWHPGGDVTLIPGTELSGPNGIELSADGRYVYVAAFGGRRIVRFERGPNPAPPVSVAVDIRADNLRWTEDGRLLTAGGNAMPGTGWSVYAIDPGSMSARRIAGADASAALQDVSTALAVGGELWFGTPGGDRVGYLDVE
jgi:predicted SnoaL-like aldol condensation-catalyzing enzyme